ncbi:MAG: peptidylprolyl isomerase [Thermoguttaceae bacterium]
MRHQSRFLLAAIAAVVSVAIAGCQRQGEATPSTPASVKGPADSPSVPGGPAAQPKLDPLHPVVQIETTLGKITLRLDAEKAPLTVDNFLTYAAAGHYDQTVFHQVLKEYPRIILGGAYTLELIEKKPRVAIRNEAHNGLKNRRGTIAMARRPDYEDSATCHFFINLTDNDVLNFKERTAQGYGYCVFGDVTDDEGLATIDRIGQVSTRDTAQFEHIPVESVVIKSVRRIK